MELSNFTRKVSAAVKPNQSSYHPLQCEVTSQLHLQEHFTIAVFV